MADTSAFATGDDFISFDFGAPPSPGAGPSRSASPASSAIGDGDILDGLTRSPPRGWKGKARADDGNGDASPVADSRASPAHDSRPSSPRLGKKRKSNGVEPDTKRPKADPYGTGPRNLKEERRAAERAAPWADDVRWDRCVDSAEMLNDEIHAFFNYMAPTAGESRVRAQMIDLIANTITEQWPDAEVLPFGSWQTGMYLPTGDIDLVVTTPRLNERMKVRLLRDLAGMMRSARITQDVAVIHRAKVPIIKFVTTEGKINVDISLNHPDTVSNGVQAAKIIQHYLNDLPGARELILVVKAFLSQRSMNEVYTGGLGSYSVICLVISFIQMHPKLRRSEMDARRNLGTLLCEFFELYGRNFNYDDVGISIRRGGRYYSKRSRGWANFNNQPFLLSIEDPQDSDNDVARSSHGIRQVKMTLSGAYDLLTATMFDRAQRIQDRRARRDRDREQAKKNGGKFSPQPPLDSQETSILATIMGVTKETQKFRRDLADLDASGRLRARVDSLFRRMGSRAVVVSNDGAKAYVRGSATDGGEKRKDKDVEVIVIDDDDAPQVPSRRTPPPAPTRDDGLGAILVDDASDMEMDLASDSMSESESDATDVNDVNDMSFGSASSDDGNAQAWSRGASVSQDSMEDGEIIDSKYATLSRKTKSKKRSKQLSAEQAAVKAEKHDKYLERRRAENERKAAAQAKRKPTAGTAPGKKVAAASDGEAPKASPAKTAGNKAKSAPGSRLPSRATSPSGPARLTADDRKAFWASKGGIIEISDDSE